MSDARSWPAKMAARNVLLRRDLHRLWFEEGPVGRAASGLRAAAGSTSSSRSIVASDDGDDSAADGGCLTPLERDERRAGLGRSWRLSLLPRRNIFTSLWSAGWNVPQGLRNAAVSIPSAVGSEMHAGRTKPAAIALGTFKALPVALQYLCISGIVSPLVLLSTGVVNSLVGCYNMYVGTLYFDSLRGYYRRGDAIEFRDARRAIDAELSAWLLVLEADYRVNQRRVAALRRTPRGRLMVSMQEYVVRKMRGSSKTMDTSAVGMKSANTVNAAVDHYEVLGVEPTATSAEIKAAFTRLAKVFHPDKNPAPEARESYDAITKAYKTLSDPAQREAYDLGGAAAAESAAARSAMEREARSSSTSSAASNRGRQRKYGGVSTVNKEGRMIGTPLEIAQSVFGGLAFSEILGGPLFRSPWHFNYQGHARCSIAEFEHAQVYRMQKIAFTLTCLLDASAVEDIGVTAVAAAIRVGILSNEDGTAAIASETGTAENARDTAPASGPTGFLQRVSPAYIARCERLATRLTKCSFGSELLLEFGEAYVVAAQRYSGDAMFYAPKRLVTVRLLSGVDRILRAIKGELGEKGLEKGTAYNIFASEYDTAATDFHTVVRFACMTAVNEVRAGQIALAELRRQFARVVDTGKAEQAPDSGAGTWEAAAAYHGKSVAGGVGVEAGDGFFVLMPPVRAPKKATAALDTAVAKVLDTVQRDPAARAKLEALLAKDLRRRRIDALGAMGMVFTKRGRRFGFREMDECTAHLRSHIGSTHNTTVPPLF